MDIRAALKGQYHGALLMLKDAAEQSPDRRWAVEGDPRSAWRIAYHTLFYADLYLRQSEADFRPWDKARRGAEKMWSDEPNVQPYSKDEILEYWAIVDGMVDVQIDGLDLDSPESGFYWYKMPKLEHVILNIRHIQEHAGQLRDRIISAGGDPDWVGRA